MTLYRTDLSTIIITKSLLDFYIRSIFGIISLSSNCILNSKIKATVLFILNNREISSVQVDGERISNQIKHYGMTG